MANTEALVQPLIQGTPGRMLAATALATFPNTALTEPTAQDRRDATSATGSTYTGSLRVLGRWMSLDLREEAGHAHRLQHDRALPEVMAWWNDRARQGTAAPSPNTQPGRRAR